MSSPGRPQEALTGPEVLTLLECGQLRPLGLMPRATNFTFLAEVTDGGRTALAVYKPRDGEAPLWDFPQGTLCRREVAAFLVAQALGWPAVPPTVLRDGPHGPGSVQLFVEADPREHYFTLRDAHLQDFRAVAAFDVVVNNADRKGGHCLLGHDRTIWVVDHGVCFSEDPKLRTVIWDFAGEEVSSELAADLQWLEDRLRGGPVRDRLRELLSAPEVQAVARRTAKLLESGVFPSPGPRRPYPWPPV